MQSFCIWIFLTICPGADVRRRVSNQRCKPCANDHDRGDMPTYLPAGLPQHVLHTISKNTPPHHATQDDVSTPFQRLEVGNIIGRQSIRGQGGDIAVMYETHRKGLLRPSWERERAFSFFATQVCATGLAPGIIAAN